MKKLKSFDIFGFKPQLRIDNDYSHRSILGGFLTLSMFVLFFSVILYTLLRNGSMIFANVTQEVIIEREPSQLLLPGGDFLIIIGFSDRALNSIEKSVFSIRMFQQNSKTAISFQRDLNEEEEIWLMPCNASHFDHLNTPHAIPSSFFNGMLCSPVNRDFMLNGDELSNNFSQIKIQVELCKNDSMRQQICAPTEVIEQTLQTKNKIKLEIFFTTHQFNILKYDQNFTTDFEHLAFQLSPRRLNSIAEIFVKELQMISSYGFLPTQSQIKNTSIPSFDNDIREYFSLWEQDDKPFLSLFFKKSQKKRLIVREMIEFFRMLSYVGGLWNPIFIFFFLVARSYNQYSFNLAVANKIFSFEKSTDESEKNLPHVNNESINKSGGALEDSIRHNKNLTVAFRFRISDIFCCLKSKRIKQKNMAKVFDAVWKEMDLPLILHKLHEISRIKRLLFDDKELKLFESVPRRYLLNIKNKTPPESHFKTYGPENYEKCAEIYSTLRRRNKNASKKLTKKLLDLVAFEFTEDNPVKEVRVEQLTHEIPKITEIAEEEGLSSMN